MTETNEVYDVLIVGAGPAGSFLAALLAARGCSVRVLESREGPGTGSRAIGIHPPALEALDTIGVASTMLADGVAIRKGALRAAGRTLGTLSFDTVSRRYPMIVALPQHRTQDILDTRLCESDADALRYGGEVTSVRDHGRFVSATVRRGSDTEEWRGRYLVGADGTSSRVRDRIGIPTTARRYPDTYLMGDFADETGDGALACLYVEKGGIVESFPLPGARRWVVRTRTLRPHATVEELASLIEERTGRRVSPDSNTMLSAFGTRRTLTPVMLAGRALLIGDAAHEISPIGGQGMNLGWLDAMALAPRLHEALGVDSVSAQRLLHQFEQSRMRSARIAARRAELNMIAGRPAPAPLHPVRLALLRALLVPPMRPALAKAFSMRGL